MLKGKTAIAHRNCAHVVSDTSLVFFCSASTVFRKRVCLHQRPLHCWEVEVRWRPWLCGRIWWGWICWNCLEKKKNPFCTSCYVCVYDGLWCFFSMAVIWSVTRTSSHVRMDTVFRSAGGVMLILTAWTAAMRKTVAVLVSIFLWVCHF